MALTALRVGRLTGRKRTSRVIQRPSKDWRSPAVPPQHPGCPGVLTRPCSCGCSRQSQHPTPGPGPLAWQYGLPRLHPSHHAGPWGGGHADLDSTDAPHVGLRCTQATGGQHPAFRAVSSPGPGNALGSGKLGAVALGRLSPVFRPWPAALTPCDP